MATRIWKNVTGSWDDVSNWIDGIPGPADTALIGNGAATKFTTQILTGASETIDTLIVNGKSATVSLEGMGALSVANDLTLAAGKVTFSTGATGSLLVGGTLAVVSGTITLVTGTTLTATTLDLQAGTARLTGAGTVDADMTGPGTISASGGTLDLLGAINGGNARLTWANVTGSVLKIAQSSSVQSVKTGGNRGKLEIADGQTLTIADQFVLSSGALALDGTTAGLTSLSGIKTTRAFKGAGRITVGSGIGDSTGLFGSATWTASGGVLDLYGSVNRSDGTNKIKLAIDTKTPSTLRLNGNVTSGAISISAANQTLEVGSTGSLTLTAAESISKGTIRLNAGAVLTNASKVTVSTGATLTGAGLVDAALAGSGTIQAAGGTLDLQQGVSGNAATLAWQDIAGSRLRIGTNSGVKTVGLGGTGTNETLEIADGRTLTVASQLNLTTGALILDGDTARITAASGIRTALDYTGVGILSAGTKTADSKSLFGSATLTASGGVLDLAAAVNMSNSTNALVLAIADIPGSALKLEGPTKAGAIAITSANQTLEIGAAAKVTITASESIDNGRIVMNAGGTLTVAAGITLNGTAGLTGAGSVAAPLSGSGTVTAAGGVLDLIGTVNSGLVLAIDNTLGGTLKFETLASAGTIGIDGANQTIEVGAAGRLTVGAVDVVNTGTIKLNAGGSLTASGGLTLGASALMTGAGSVTGPIAGSGTVFATGGTLSLSGDVAPGVALAIDNAKASALTLDGSVTTAPITINTATQTLTLGTGAEVTFTAAQTLTNGALNLNAGAVLSNAGGITLGAAARLSGAGTVNAAIDGIGTINTSSGTLDLAGGVTGGQVALTWSNIAGSVLKIGQDSHVLSAALGGSGTRETLEISAGRTLTLTNALALTTGVLKLDSETSGLTALSGIGSNLSYTGMGIISVGTSVGDTTGLFGTSTWKASGGVLKLDGSVNQSSGTNKIKLAIDTVAGSTLKIGGIATSGAISINNANQTLEIDHAGQLTLTAAESITKGIIKLNAGAVLTDAAKITIGSGATLLGVGTVNGPLTVTGRANATGGLLTLNGTIGGTGTLEILNDGTLEVTGSVASTVRVDFSHGTLEIGAPSQFFGKLYDLQHGDVIGFGTLSVSNVDYTQNGGTGTLAVDFDGGASTTISLVGTYAPSHFTVVAGNVEVACFAAGTGIRTDRGDVAVEALRAGDIAWTQDGPRRIVWIGHRRIDLTRHARPTAVRPIRVRRHALAPDIPSRDLLLSPDHAVLVDGYLVPIRHLVNGTTIRQETHRRHITYFHVETTQHSVLMANDALVESYLDTGNRNMFANAGGALNLYPDFGGGSSAQSRRETESCRPMASDPAQRRAIWAVLARRAANLGYTAQFHATCTDPEPHLVVGDRLIRPIHAAEGRLSFVVPASARLIRLRSRSTVPAALAPWVDDSRRLGLAVRRIRLDGAHGPQDVPVDAPALAAGWWEPEREGAQLWRWTNGDAAIEIAPGTRQVTFETSALAHYADEECPVAATALLA